MQQKIQNSGERMQFPAAVEQSRHDHGIGAPGCGSRPVEIFKS